MIVRETLTTKNLTSVLTSSIVFVSNRIINRHNEKKGFFHKRTVFPSCYRLKTPESKTRILYSLMVLH